MFVRSVDQWIFKNRSIKLFKDFYQVLCALRTSKNHLKPKFLVLGFLTTISIVNTIHFTYCETEHTVPFGNTSNAFTDIFRLSSPLLQTACKHPGVHMLSKWWMALRYGCFPVLRFSWINLGSNHFWIMSPSALCEKKKKKKVFCK